MPLKHLKILSLYWGYSLGGIGKYGTLINQVSRIAPINFVHICILANEWETDIGTLQSLEAQQVVIKSRLDFSWIYKIKEKVDQERPDIIITHGFNGHFVSWLFSLFYQTSAIPIASYHGLYHASIPSRRLLQPIFNRFTEFFIRKKAISTVVVAEHSKHYLISRNVPPEKIQVIHNGLKDKAISNGNRLNILKSLGLSESNINLGVVSRLDKVKGIKYLLMAFEKLAPMYPSLRLVVVGSGASEDELKKQARRLKIDGAVNFTGYRDDIDSCLIAFDIFILPSLAEYHSIALLEAMRAEKAIIATNVGGNTESVRHEKEALIVRPADDVELAKAIERLVLNPELRFSLGRRALGRFRTHFTTDVMVKKTADWLMKCAEAEAKKVRC